MEELENLEETLNDSIRESIGARTGKISHGKKKGAVDDEDEYVRYNITNRRKLLGKLRFIEKDFMFEYQWTTYLNCLSLFYMLVFPF